MITKKITLSGFTGSGKSTVGKIIAEKLKYEFISIGNYSRKFALDEFNLNINDFQEKCKKDPEIDKEIDLRFKKYCNAKDKIIVDYRLGFHFVENSLNILLKVSNSIAVQRICISGRNGEETNQKSILNRNNIKKDRFIELYDVDFTDEENYDFVINTDYISSDRIVDLKIEKLDLRNN